MDRFPAAPWSALVKITSALATILLVGAAYAALSAVPRGTRAPFAESFGVAIAFVPPMVLLGAILFVVAGYELEGSELHIRRLLWSTRVDLQGVERAWHDPEAMKRSLRLFGNGGLYSVTGVFQNRALGRYRAFVTDPKRAVVLRLPSRVVVISPAEPDEFLRRLTVAFPGLPPAHSAGTV